MSRQIPWLRVFAEGAVIVVSILLAFGIDAWWDDVQAATEEQEALRQLRAEFRTTAGALDYSKAVHQRRHDAAARLVSMAGPAAEVSDIARVAADVRDVRTSGSFEPPSGALSSLISSGRISLISDPGLRGELSAWPERVAALNGAEDRITRFVEDHVAPFLIRRTAVASLYHDAEVGFAPVPSAHAYDLRALLRERELENLAFNKQALELIALRQIDELEERVGRILAGIESQVD